MSAHPDFPALPPPPEGLASWPNGALTAYDLVSKAYDNGRTLCQEQCSEGFRLEIARDRLLDLHFILVGLTYNGISMEWVQDAATLLVALEEDLMTAKVHAEGE